MCFKREKSFTLVEILVVIGVLAALTTAIIFVLKPVEMLREVKDIQRLSDLNILNKALAIYQTDGNTSFGSSSVIYISIPDVSPTCANLGLPSLPSGWSYACAPTSTYHQVNGAGWIPVDFTDVSFGSPLSVLPIDPINTTSTHKYYTYVAGGSWKLSALFESKKYVEKSAADDGPDPTAYEIGTNLSLAPFARNLVGYWKFDEGSGNVTADSSGYGNNGALYNGPTWDSGKVGNALSFDGINDYVQTPSISGPGTDFAVTTWSYPRAFSNPPDNDNGYVFWHWGSYGFIYYYDPIVLEAFFPGDCNTYIRPIVGTIPLNTWHFIAYTYEGGRMKLYYDNNLVSDFAKNCSVGAIADNVDMGLRSDTPTVRRFNGKIDEIRIYNRALNDAEIKAIYDATK